MTEKTQRPRYSPEVRARAVRMVAERDSGARAGPTSEDLQRIKALERENRELRQANEILRKASASRNAA